MQQGVDIKVSNFSKERNHRGTLDLHGRSFAKGEQNAGIVPLI